MVTLVIPAAGAGTRLGAQGPKALATVHGRPLIGWVTAACIPHVDQCVVVVRPDQLPLFVEWESRAHLGVPVSWALQDTPTGSLDAVKIGVAHALTNEAAVGSIVIAWADQVGISGNTVGLVVDLLRTGGEFTLVVPTSWCARPYVWLEQAHGRIVGVKRQRDGDPSPAMGLADLGLFGLSGELATWLVRNSSGLVQADGREADFTYALPLLSRVARISLSPRVDDPHATLAVNSRGDVLIAEEMLNAP